MVDATDILPMYFENSQGKLKTARGTKDEKMIMSWDVVPYCRPETCPAIRYCDYIKDETRKCKVMKEYLRNINIVIFRNIEKHATEDQLMRIGLELIPLYAHLCKLKLEEIAVGDIVSTSDSGVARANVIYKEHRETVRLIASLWASIGLSEPSKIPRTGGKLRNTPSDEQPLEGDFTHGNPSFHKNLEDEILKENRQKKSKLVI